MSNVLNDGRMNDVFMKTSGYSKPEYQSSDCCTQLLSSVVHCLVPVSFRLQDNILDIIRYCFPWPTTINISYNCTCPLEGFQCPWNDTLVNSKLLGHTPQTTTFLKLVHHPTLCKGILTIYCSQIAHTISISFAENIWKCTFPPTFKVTFQSAKWLYVFCVLSCHIWHHESKICSCIVFLLSWLFIALIAENPSSQFHGCMQEKWFKFCTLM